MCKTLNVVSNSALNLSIPVVTDKCGEALLATDYHTNGPFSFKNPAQLSYTGMLLMSRTVFDTSYIVKLLLSCILFLLLNRNTIHIKI